MKKLICILSISLITISLTACNFRLSMLDRETASEKSITEKMVKKIVAALENKDSNALKDLFSINVRKNAKDLDKGIEYLMKFYQGKSISFEDKLGSSFENDEHGEIEKSIKRGYIVKTEINSYEFEFTVKQNDNDKNDDGLFQMRIVKQGDKRDILWILHEDTAGVLWDEKLIPEDYVAGATRALSNGIEDSLAAIFSKDVHNKSGNLASEIKTVTNKFRGYADYDNFPAVNVLLTQTEGNRTVIKATCELPTKTFDGTKDITYLIYFVYIKYSESMDDSGLYTVQIIEKTNKNSQFKIYDDVGIFYEDS